MLLFMQRNLRHHPLINPAMVKVDGGFSQGVVVAMCHDDTWKILGGSDVLYARLTNLTSMYRSHSGDRWSQTVWTLSHI